MAQKLYTSAIIGIIVAISIFACIALWLLIYCLFPICNLAVSKCFRYKIHTELERHEEMMKLDDVQQMEENSKSEQKQDNSGVDIYSEQFIQKLEKELYSYSPWKAKIERRRLRREKFLQEMERRLRGERLLSKQEKSLIGQKTFERKMRRGTLGWQLPLSSVRFLREELEIMSLKRHSPYFHQVSVVDVNGKRRKFNGSEGDGVQSHVILSPTLIDQSELNYRYTDTMTTVSAISLRS